MTGILLTKDSTFILGPVANILGWIMNVIFEFMSFAFKVENIGITIILFTIVVYMILLPLTIKQQRSSKLSAKMNPELQAIQKKYEGKKDQVSMFKMQEETKMVYQKYGTSLTGSCLQMVIQLPILFSLYRVIYAIPAYIVKVKEVFLPLVDRILGNPSAVEAIQTYGETFRLSSKLDYTQANSVVDVLYKFSSSNWSELADKFPDLSSTIANTQTHLESMNNFLGMNIANSPMSMLSAGLWLALLIPILAGLTQWLNLKLMPQAAAVPTTPGGADKGMQGTMKTMNMITPIMSIVFCFTLPAGMGLYWIAGSVVRCVQQLLINKHIDKMDIDALVEKNLEKINKKRAKEGLPPQKPINVSKYQAQNLQNEKAKNTNNIARQKNIKDSTEYYNNDPKAGSLASKAAMVKKYNEKNKK